MTTLPLPGDPGTLYILDLHCWMHRFHRTMMGRSAHGFIEFVTKIIRDRAPSHIAVCTDLPWPTFRHQLAPKVYKAQRDPPDPNLIERIRWAKEMLEDLLGIKVFAAKGYEADDLIAVLTKRAVEDGLKVVIVAIDKDLLQLVDGERVFMWDSKQAVWGTPEVIAKFGVRPDQLRDYLAIVGDSSDNVPGVKGAGPKAAVELLTAFDTLDRAIAATQLICPRPELFKKRPTYRELLTTNVAMAELSKTLVTLALDAPLTYDRAELAYATDY